MKLDINAKDDFKITWTLRVTDTAKAGDLIKNSTFLGGVDIYNELVVTVSGYTDAQLSAVKDAALSYAASGTSFTDPIELARSAYKTALGRDLFDFATVEEIITELYSTKYLNEDSELMSMLVPNMFGGTAVSGRSLSDERVRRMYESNLEIGDIIVCSWSTNARVFIYVGDGKLVTTDNITGTAATVENGNEDFVKDGSAFYLKSTLGTIVAYEEFAVLRPSMMGN